MFCVKVMEVKVDNFSHSQYTENIKMLYRNNHVGFFAEPDWKKLDKHGRSSYYFHKCVMRNEIQMSFLFKGK